MNLSSKAGQIPVGVGGVSPTQAQREVTPLSGWLPWSPWTEDQFTGQTHSSLGLLSQARLLLSATSVNQAPVTLQTADHGEESLRQEDQASQALPGACGSFKGRGLIYEAASGSRLPQSRACTSSKLCISPEMGGQRI